MAIKYCLCGNERKVGEVSCSECKEIEQRNKNNLIKRTSVNKIQRDKYLGLSLRGKANGITWT